MSTLGVTVSRNHPLYQSTFTYYMSAYMFTQAYYLHFYW